MRGARNPALLLILQLTILSGILGFGTINEPKVIGQHCEHERITRAALACPPGVKTSDGRCFEELSLYQLAGRSGPEGYFGQGSNGAVGAPDMLDPIPEGPEAHCDNADFLDSTSYPRTRQQATAQLQACTDHLRRRFSEGVDAADQIVDEYARIVNSAVDIWTLDCRFSFPELQMHIFRRSKCSAIEGFGRALHGIQDFFAHSNWADDSKPPFSSENPPGLKRSDYPVFLDLRAENDISEQVPHNLSTGCFGGILTDGPVGKAGHPLEPGSLDCTGRITHHTLNKDNGLIDHVTGLATRPGPNTPRSNIHGNFQRAVFAAIKDTNRQWRHFREEIRQSYGTERGNIIVCALVRDNPSVDCYGRIVAMLRDAPENIKRKEANRVAEMQIPIHQWLLEELEGKEHNEGPGEGLTSHNTTKSKGSSDELHEGAKGSELSEDTPHASKGFDVGSAVDELLRNTAGLPTNKTSIVAFTSARDVHLWEQVAQVWRAGDEGIRVHLGLLPTTHTTHDTESPDNKKAAVLVKAKREDLITAVLRSGGTYSVLHGRSSIPRFLDHVVSRGLTQYDNAKDTSILLVPGLSISDYVTTESEPRRFSFDAHAMDSVVIAVAPTTANLSLHVSVRHLRKNQVIDEMDIGLNGNATFRAELAVYDVPRTDAWFELEVAHVAGRGLEGSGLFEVSMETERAGKNRDASEDASELGRGHDEL